MNEYPYGNQFPVMENMTVKEIRTYLTCKKSIIIPIGVTEQHGYHLPLKTDALIATHLGRRIGGGIGMLVAPTITTSFSGGGLPGTINISPSVMALVISDMLVSLAAQGFRNFYLFPCHGGSENFRALNDAARILLRSNPAFAKAMIVLMPVWKLNTKGTGFEKGFTDHDWHAGYVETSLVMALEPEAVRMSEMELDTEPLLGLQIQHPDNYQHAEKIVDDDFVVPRLTQRPEIQVGVMGYPDRASAKLGMQIVDDIVQNACAKVKELEAKADGKYKEVSFHPEPLVLE